MTGIYQVQHLKPLTGLRFVAALSVFAAHSLDRWPLVDAGNLPLGAAGVGFFYLLSGFILTYVYANRFRSGDADTDPKTNQFSYWKFYIRRFARIWPIHLATLLIFLFCVMGPDVFVRRGNPVGKLLANLLLIQSWIPNYDWIYSLNGPSWSLAVESFFYLVFPVLILGGTRRFLWIYGLIAVATVTAIIGLSCLELESNSWVALNGIMHTNPLMRLFEFATGVGCGFLFLAREDSGVQKPTGSVKNTLVELLVLGLLVGFFAGLNSLGWYQNPMEGNGINPFPPIVMYWIRFSSPFLIFAFVILVFASSKGLVSRALASRPMVYLGDISYAFYMIHMSVMIVMLRQTWVEGWWSMLAATTCAFSISLFFASALYHLVEVPFRSSIVQLSETRNWEVIWQSVWTSLLVWLKSPAFLILLSFTLLSGWYASSYRIDPRDEIRIAAVIAASDSALKSVNFSEDATLLGCRASLGENGSLSLSLVWKLYEGRRSDRFVKLLDADEKVIGRGSANSQLFKHATSNETVLDSVEIPAARMKNVELIAVGFFEQGRKASVVDSGPRSNRNRQLNVWERKR